MKLFILHLAGHGYLLGLFDPAQDKLLVSTSTWYGNPCEDNGVQTPEVQEICFCKTLDLMRLYPNWYTTTNAYTEVDECSRATTIKYCRNGFLPKEVTGVLRVFPPDSPLLPEYLSSTTVAWGRRFKEQCYPDAMAFIELTKMYELGVP